MSLSKTCFSHRAIASLLALVWVLGSCGPGKKSEAELPAAFKTFTDGFTTVSTPLTWTGESLTGPEVADIPAADVKTYLGIEAAGVFPMSKVMGSDYVALVALVQWDEMDASIVAFFFDMQAVKQGEVVVCGTSYEVKENFAFVEKASWEGNTIRRTLEYHYGNDETESHHADVVSTIGPAGQLQQVPETITPQATATTGGTEETTPAPGIEVITYLSQAMPGVEITGIYPFESAPVLLVHTQETVRELSLDEAGGPPPIAIIGDDDFAALSMQEAVEAEDNVISFRQLSLKKKDGTDVLFQQAAIKRAPVAIGSNYGYTNGEEKGYGKLTFTDVEPLTLKFSSDITTAAPEYHLCNAAGVVARRNNIGYFQQNYSGEGDCRVVFVFADKVVNVFQVSGNSACDCGANATLSGAYTAEP